MEFISFTDKDGNIQIDADTMEKLKRMLKGSRGYWTVEKFEPSKLGQKRRQYFAGIVKPAAMELGITKDDLHDTLKYYVNPIEKHDPLTGEIRTVGGSTKLFKTPAEWETFKHKCRQLLEKLKIKTETEEQYYNRISATDTKPTTTFGE